MCVEDSNLFFINHQQTAVIKVSSSTFDRLTIPIGEDKLYQISVNSNRIYAVSENGNVVICYRQSDKLFAPVKSKHMKDSDDESDGMSDDEGMVSKYRTKIVKIKAFDEVMDDGDVTNVSIIAGSDNEDNHAHDPDEFVHRPLST